MGGHSRYSGTTTDVSPTLEWNKKLQNEPQKSESFHHIASIPAIVIEQWLIESGLSYGSREFTQFMRRKLQRQGLDISEDYGQEALEMALDNLAGLKASALAWIERVGDPAAETIVADCVTLCEAAINKTPTFRLPEMETEATLTLIAGTGAVTDRLPGDEARGGELQCAAIAPIRRAGLVQSSVPRRRHERELRLLYDRRGAGPDRPGAAAADAALRGPARTSSILYYAKVPALVTTDPNWLLLKSPDVYLYGTILEMLVALEGDQQDKYAGLFGSAVESLVAAQTYSRGGVLTQRASMPAP